jgi:PhzF family phenazine biosynthesis protein
MRRGLCAEMYHSRHYSADTPFPGAMPLPFRVVDAFASAPFTGNPAAVFVLDTFPEDALMQRVALEMSLSESAFVVGSGESTWDLRWFTPAAEVNLCGHATLASAHVLFESGLVPGDQVARFRTLSGELAVRRKGDGRLSMDFPAEPVSPSEPPPGLEAALGAGILAFGRNRMDYLVELSGEAAVRSLRPDIGALSRFDARGVIVTAAAAGEYDFVSRFFGPRVGVPEDPVTGSAHCARAPWWHQRMGRRRMTAWQASARGGRVEVELRGDRVEIVGSAVTVSEGRILV